MIAEIKKRRLSGRQTAERVKEIQGKQAEPEVHILRDWQLQRIAGFVGYLYVVWIEIGQDARHS